VPRGPWLAPVEVTLDGGDIERESWRAAIDHTADGWTMRLAERGHPEQGAEGIAGHAKHPGSATGG